MVKVHILGGAGSGKTVLAQHLAARMSVPHYDFDRIGQRFGPRPQPYVDATRAIVLQPGWISEGIYVLIIDLLLEAADYIVVLDIPWSVAAARIVRRHITTSLRGTNRYPGMKLLVQLLKGSRRYYLNQRPEMVNTMRQYFDTYGAVSRPAPADTMYAKSKAFPNLVIPPTAAFVRRYVEPYEEKTRFIRTKADLQQFVHDLDPVGRRPNIAT